MEKKLDLAEDFPPRSLAQVSQHPEVTERILSAVVRITGRPIRTRLHDELLLSALCGSYDQRIFVNLLSRELEVRLPIDCTLAMAIKILKC